MALCFAGHDLLMPHVQDRTPSTPAIGQGLPYRQIPALLAQARRHDPALRLPHAHWFIQVRHGHAQVVVVDQAPFQGNGGTVDMPRKGQR